jgi:hypothetical protein
VKFGEIKLSRAIGNLGGRSFTGLKVLVVRSLRTILRGMQRERQSDITRVYLRGQSSVREEKCHPFT